MKIRTFKNYIGATHKIALSKILSVPLNKTETKGIDLLNEEIGVEVKGCLVRPESSRYKDNYVSWKFFDYQLHWGSVYSQELYCALGTYELNAVVSELDCSMNIGEIEDLVTRREFWIAPWSWSEEFPIANGKHHDYRYLVPNPTKSRKIKSMPRVISSKKMNKGLLHFVEGVDIQKFL